LFRYCSVYFFVFLFFVFFLQYFCKQTQYSIDTQLRKKKNHFTTLYTRVTPVCVNAICARSENWFPIFRYYYIKAIGRVHVRTSHDFLESTTSSVGRVSWRAPLRRASHKVICNNIRHRVYNNMKSFSTNFSPSETSLISLTTPFRKINNNLTFYNQKKKNKQLINNK
jgi:hypothetical protein